MKYGIKFDSQAIVVFKKNRTMATANYSGEWGRSPRALMDLNSYHMTMHFMGGGGIKANHAMPYMSVGTLCRGTQSVGLPLVNGGGGGGGERFSFLSKPRITVWVPKIPGRVLGLPRAWGGPPSAPSSRPAQPCEGGAPETDRSPEPTGHTSLGRPTMHVAVSGRLPATLR